MKLTKRVIATILCIIILALSPMASYIDTTSITKVYAASPGVLTAEIMYVICQYFGSVALAYAPIQRTDLPTDEEVLRTGYAVAQYFSNPTASNTELATKAGLVFYDSMGQSYVFGSEALKETAETDFSVIQGGVNPYYKNDDDDDENKKTGKRLLEFYRAGEVFVATSAILGDYITDKIYEAYSNFVKGEPSLYDSVFADLADQSFTSTNYEAQWAGDYNIKIGFSVSCTYTDPVTKKVSYGTNRYAYDTMASVPAAVYYTESPYLKDGNVIGYNYRYSFIKKYGNSYKSLELDCICDSFDDIGHHNNFETSKSGVSYDNYLSSDCGTYTDSFATVSANIPVFDSLEAAKSYLAGKLDYTNALNYTKIYREADWLSEDWAGTLIDPLTGLNALGDFVNIARHQGLNALGNELTPDDFTDYLRDYFANVGTGLDTYPNFNPALDPIVYDPTGTMPDFTLDPARNPVIQPSTSPGTDPSPGVDPSPGPGVNPGTEINLDEELPSMPSALLPLAGELKHKFPFSIPWDLQYLFEQLSGSSASSAYSVTYYDDGGHGGGGASRPGENQAPRWVIPVVVGSSGIHEELVIDLKDFQAVSDISRTLLSVLFCVCLMKFTIKIVEMRKEE